jgi:hypothetical protein
MEKPFTKILPLFEPFCYRNLCLQRSPNVRRIVWAGAALKKI